MSDTLWAGTLYVIGAFAQAHRDMTWSSLSIMFGWGGRPAWAIVVRAVLWPALPITSAIIDAINRRRR